MPATLGSKTLSRFAYDPEVHKLALEFDVAAGQAVHAGDAVVMNNDGTIQAAASADPAWKIIGYSLHDSGTADTDHQGRATIVMKGFAVVNGGAAAGPQIAGPVQLDAWDATNLRRNYAAITGASDAAKMATLAGISLTVGVNVNDPILVVVPF